MTRMTNRRFECFVAAARELHIGRAAERLGIAQPALSQQIRALEQSVGARLLRRAGRGIALTEAGAAILPEAAAALEQEARAVHVARRAARGELGEISIGYVNTAMLGPELPTLLSAFRRSVPDARIDLRYATPNNFTDTEAGTLSADTNGGKTCSGTAASSNTALCWP